MDSKEDTTEAQDCGPRRAFPFTRAQGERQIFQRPPRDESEKAKRVHNELGLDFFRVLILHELGHALANTLCGRACSIQIEEWGFAHACHDRTHTLVPPDEVFVAALGGAVHLAYLLNQSANLSQEFLTNYVFYAIDKDARRARANPALLPGLIVDEIVPQLLGSFIAKMEEFAEAIAKDSNGISYLCHYDITDDAEILMPEVFEVLSKTRETCRILCQMDGAHASG